MLKEFYEAKEVRRKHAKLKAGDDWDTDGYEDDAEEPQFSDIEVEEKPKAKATKAEGDEATAEVDEF